VLLMNLPAGERSRRYGDADLMVLALDLDAR
jgi:hypothetical protein